MKALTELPLGSFQAFCAVRIQAYHAEQIQAYCVVRIQAYLAKSI